MNLSINDAVNIMNLVTRLLLNNRLRIYVPSSTYMLEPNISAFNRVEVWIRSGLTFFVGSETGSS